MNRSLINQFDATLLDLIENAVNLPTFFFGDALTAEQNGRKMKVFLSIDAPAIEDAINNSFRWQIESILRRFYHRTLGCFV